MNRSIIRKNTVLALAFCGLTSTAAFAQPPADSKLSDEEMDQLAPEELTMKGTKGQPTAKEVEVLQALLKDVDPSKYSLSVTLDGRDEVRMGNAAIRDLRTIKVIHPAGDRPGLAANEIVTTVSNYVRIIWTSKLESIDVAKVARVNALLDRVSNPAVRGKSL
jgi:hypothetical protein